MIRLFLIVLLILISIQTQAIHLSKDDTGQVLIFPYYTVNNDILTILNLVNTTDEAKAIRVRYREAANGKEVFALNLYLGPNDVWTAGTLESLEEGGFPRVISFDNSCTYPSFESDTQLFNSDGFTGEFVDVYGTESNRLREGFIEVIEMGVLTGDSAIATLIDEDSNEADCEVFADAWGIESANPYWINDPNTDLSPPTGGLEGNLALTNVIDGFSVTQKATVLENFSNQILHYNYNNASPNLADGNNTAIIQSQGGTRDELNFSSGALAVSSLLMTSSVTNEYVINQDINASTNWIMTMPTRQFHIDPDTTESNVSVAPFDQIANGSDINCENFNIQGFYNRESVLVEQSNTTPATEPSLCFATSNIGILNGDFHGIKYLSDTDNKGVFASNYSIMSPDNGKYKAIGIETSYKDGWMELKFQQSTQDEDESSGLKVRGLPVIGFAAQRYINANAEPGLLANYAGIFEHKKEATVIHPQLPILPFGDSVYGMSLSKDNHGQVLLFPYYTVKNGFDTLISVVNTTDYVKALKINFLEGKNSRVALSFNIYLDAYDVWTAGLVNSQSTVPGYNGDDSVKLITFDNSCTVPQINGQEFLPYHYTGEFDDGLGADMQRVQEGTIEIFEMGAVIGNDAVAATHNEDGNPNNCSQLIANWIPPSGKWLDDSSINVATDVEGSKLFGSASLINVSDGTDMSYDATAIVNFNSGISHVSPSDLSLNLASGNQATTIISTDNDIIQTTWNSPIDAVTALFMQSESINDFVIDQNIQAQTDWVNSFPTKQFYVDPYYSDSETALAPFNQLLESGGSCEAHSFRAHDREQDVNDYHIGIGCGSPPNPHCGELPEMCWSVNVSSVNYDFQNDSIFASNLTINDWDTDPVYSSIGSLFFSSGWMEMVYDFDGQDQAKLVGTGPNGEIHEIVGKPVLGFVVQKYSNNNAQPGLLANYADLKMNKGKRKITIQAQQ